MIETALLANWISLTLLWLISLRMKDSSIIDIYWGFGFVLICWVCLLSNQNDDLAVSITQGTLLSMVTIWGLRLTFYLAKRNLGHGEDYRYTKMRNSSKKDWRIVSYFRVFMLQGVLQAIIAAPIFIIFGANEVSDSMPIILTALFLFAVGFLFESIADQQMKKFKSDPNSSFLS